MSLSLTKLTQLQPPFILTGAAVAFGGPYYAYEPRSHVAGGLEPRAYIPGGEESAAYVAGGQEPITAGN